VVRNVGKDADEAIEVAQLRPWKLDFDVAGGELTVRGLGIDSRWTTDLKIGGTADAARFTGRADLIRGDDETALDQWIHHAVGTELDALAEGIKRDIDAVKAAIIYPWSTSPIEGRINRLKTLKRQMYGRAGCELLRNRC